MQLQINIKQLGKSGRRIKAVPFNYKSTPETAEQLIRETVLIMLEQFRKKYDASMTEQIPQPLSEEDMKSLAEIGRIAFGFIYNGNLPDPEKAVDTAVTAWKDGIVRLFINGEEIEPSEIQRLDIEENDNVDIHTDGTNKASQEKPLCLSDGDEVTFIRLAMLAGRMW